MKYKLTYNLLKANGDSMLHENHDQQCEKKYHKTIINYVFDDKRLVSPNQRSSRQANLR